MYKILITFAVILIPLITSAQVMKVVPYTDTTEHFTILKVNNPTVADIIVMEVNKRADVSKIKRTSNNVYWKIIPIGKSGKSGKYDYKIKIVSEGTKHNLKVYFTTNHAVVRMKSEQLRFGLQYYVTHLKK